MSTTDQAVSARPEALEAIIALQREVAESGVGLDRVMRLVARRGQELTGGTGALVEVVDGGEMVGRAAVGSATTHLGQRLPMEGTLSGPSLRSGRTLRCDDVETDRSVDPGQCARLEARSLVVAPIRTTGFAGGVLKVLSDGTNTFDAADVRAVELLAGVVAAAVSRSAGHDVRARQDLLDPLTGVANRTLFLDRLGAALARLGRHRSTVAVMCVDLDGFHSVNESLGRGIGDRLLVAAAGRIREIVRGTDTVARISGDDFALVCEDAGGPRGAAWVAERVLEWLARPFREDGHEITVGASIGIPWLSAPTPTRRTSFEMPGRPCTRPSPTAGADIDSPRGPRTDLDDVRILEEQPHRG
jgi:diguanylate cyclase (GGDEF)-like protein